jgi:hypothetical protein
MCSRPAKAHRRGPLRLPPVGPICKFKLESRYTISFGKQDHRATRAALLVTVNGPLLSRTRDNGLLGPVALPPLGTQGYSIGDNPSRRNE